MMQFKDNPNFAPEYSRTEEGWVIFPSDATYRKQMFPEAVSGHIAKANVFLVQAIVEYVSEPGQTLLDPMAGSGTLMVAALMGRDVILIEINPRYCAWQRLALEFLDTHTAPGISSHINIFNSPLQVILPMPGAADHIIFSPQYASIMKTKGKDKLTRETMGDIAGEYTYSHPLNLGTMNDWLWAKEMTKIYKRCFDTLKPGGTMTLIVKDHMEKRQRAALSKPALDSCTSIGFSCKDWFKWKAPGSVYTGIHRSRGWEVVEDEDIIIVQKPAIQMPHEPIALKLNAMQPVPA